MANVVVPFKVKRRTSGATGAPSSLLAGQIAYNEVDGLFYVGYGDDGSGNATSIKTFAKDDFSVNKLLPAGGANGYVLTKTSTGDYAVAWQAPAQSYTAGSGIGISGGVISADGTIARLASPALTGTPTAPTASLADNSTTLATTAFVNMAMNSILTKSVAGGSAVALSATEASNAVIVLTGALTANINVTVPATALGTFVVVNSTSGAYTVTLKTPSGSGIPIAQGKSSIVYCDGTNVYSARNDFDSIALTGTPTTTTPATADNSFKVASTAFVQANLASYATTASLSTYAPLASPALTGSPTAPTQTANDNSTKIASTAYVATAVTNGTAGLLSSATAASTYSPIASPTFTGTPLAPTPTAGTNTTQIATTAFVAAAIAAVSQGLSPKPGVRLISSANIASLSGTMTIDSVAAAIGDRVLLIGQTTASQNGIWIVAAGAWSRASDMSTWAQVCTTSGNAYVLAAKGSQWGGHGFMVTNDPDTAGTIDSTAMNWQEFTGATDIVAGNGISKSGNTLTVNYASGLTVSAGQLVVDFTSVASLASPALTGTPSAPTAVTSTNTTQLATTAFVQQELTNLVIDGGVF